VFLLHNAYSAHKIVNTMCHISIFRLEEMVPTQAGHVTKQMNILSLPCRQREGKGEMNPASQMSCMDNGQRQHSQDTFRMSGSKLLL